MEFLAGRLAARRALAGLGRPAVAVPMAEDRAPVWPEGVVGSISHAAGLAVAVVADAPALLGVDIARLEPFEAALIPEICRPEERALIPLEGQGLFACALFSAKEAAFKAQYPVTGLIFGFHGLRLDFARGIAEYTDHPDLATLRHESRQPLPVAQRQSAGLILSLSVRFG
jgi:4'-phosphopantetheinyl transferase EntD